MKQGMTLHEMATAIEATRAAKADYIGSTEKMYMRPDDGKIEIEGVTSEPFNLTKHAARQITSWAKIDAKYADRCPTELLAINVNHWLKNTPDNRMLRTMNPNQYLDIKEPTMRAFVSEKYRRIDNYDIAESVLPPLMEREAKGEIIIESHNVSPEKFYLKARINNVEENILREGHVIGEGHNSYFKVRPGIEIGNSEIGQGSFYVAPCLYDESCTNMATFRKNAQRRYHVGTAQSDSELWKMLSDETQRISNEALMAQMKDYVLSALNASGDVFQETCNMLREKMGLEIIRPEATMKLVASEFGINENETNGVLHALMKRGDMNVFGIQAAVTQFSQETEVTYDRASELESIGGSILELPLNRWETILKQAEEMKVAA